MEWHSQKFVLRVHNSTSNKCGAFMDTRISPRRKHRFFTGGGACRGVFHEARNIWDTFGGATSEIVSVYNEL